jgi:hypothetical protein
MITPSLHSVLFSGNIRVAAVGGSTGFIPSSPLSSLLQEATLINKNKYIGSIFFNLLIAL